MWWWEPSVWVLSSPAVFLTLIHDQNHLLSCGRQQSSHGHKAGFTIKKYCNVNIMNVDWHQQSDGDKQNKKNQGTYCCSNTNIADGDRWQHIINTSHAYNSNTHSHGSSTTKRVVPSVGVISFARPTPMIVFPRILRLPSLPSDAPYTWFHVKYERNYLWKVLKILLNTTIDRVECCFLGGLQYFSRNFGISRYFPGKIPNCGKILKKTEKHSSSRSTPSIYYLVLNTL